MSRLPLKIACILILLLLSNSCPGQISEVQPDYTAGDSGLTITVKPGETFTVGLFAAPSTAYFWEVVELDAKVVKNTSSEFVPDPATKNTVGGGGTDIWEFQAVAEGTTKLKMENARTSEPREPRGEFELTINVAGS